MKKLRAKRSPRQPRALPAHPASCSSKAPKSATTSVDAGTTGRIKRSKMPSDKVRDPVYIQENQTSPAQMCHC